MNCLVRWCVQMDRLSLVKTSEIKYTEKYCYNKERKQSSLTSCQFYLITKQTTTLQSFQEETIALKVHVYQTIFQPKLDISRRNSVQNSNGVRPTNDLQVKY